MAIERDKDFITVHNGLVNKYQLTMEIADKANKKRDELNNTILNSEALTWAIQGIEPKERKEITKQQTRYTNIGWLNYIDDLMTQIDDEEVKEAVRESFDESCRRKRVVYEYVGLTDEFKKARVRILTNMAWDNIQ